MRVWGCSDLKIITPQPLAPLAPASTTALSRISNYEYRITNNVILQWGPLITNFEKLIAKIFSKWRNNAKLNQAPLKFSPIFFENNAKFIST
jgi:hypothetical protein